MPSASYRQSVLCRRDSAGRWRGSVDRGQGREAPGGPPSSSLKLSWMTSARSRGRRPAAAPAFRGRCAGPPARRPQAGGGDGCRCCRADVVVGPGLCATVCGAGHVVHGVGAGPPAVARHLRRRAAHLQPLPGTDCSTPLRSCRSSLPPLPCSRGSPSIVSFLCAQMYGAESVVLGASLCALLNMASGRANLSAAGYSRLNVSVAALSVAAAAQIVGGLGARVLPPGIVTYVALTQARPGAQPVHGWAGWDRKEGRNEEGRRFGKLLGPPLCAGYGGQSCSP